jgi:glycosyltransferase involved in cell wall biosynthesis
MGIGLSRLQKKPFLAYLSPKTQFSIVVPTRNEADSILKLLQSISEVSYPSSLFEVFIVDDNSQDESWKQVRRFQAQHREIKIYLLSNSEGKFTPKKNAIHKAIQLAHTDYILTTDADIQVPEHWLKEFDTRLQATDARLVAGGVVVSQNKSFLSVYQHYDMLSLQAFGLASFAYGKPVICNGANLCYHKKTYLQADVNKGYEQVASGDDVFTLQSFKQNGLKIEFLSSSSSVVWTEPVKSFSGLWQQRKRWAKKTASVDSKYLKGVGILVTLVQLTFVVALALGFWDTRFFGFIVTAFMVKLIIDGWYLSKMAKIQNLTFCWTDFLKVSLVYPFLTLLFSLSSLSGSFEWKGRRFSK